MSNHGWDLYKKINADLESPTGTALVMVVEAIVKHEEAKETLQKEISYLMDTLARAEEHLTQGYHVNSLGIVGSQGVSIDRLCGLYEQAATDVKRTMHDVVKLGVVTGADVQALVEGTDWEQVQA